MVFVFLLKVEAVFYWEIFMNLLYHSLCSEMSEWSSPRNVALSLIYMPYSIYIIFSRLHFWLQCLNLWISHGSWSSQSTAKRIIKEKLLFSGNACVRNRSSHIQNIISVMANDWLVKKVLVPANGYKQRVRHLSNLGGNTVVWSWSCDLGVLKQTSEQCFKKAVLDA